MNLDNTANMNRKSTTLNLFAASPYHSGNRRRPLVHSLHGHHFSAVAHVLVIGQLHVQVRDFHLAQLPHKVLVVSRGLFGLVQGTVKSTSGGQPHPHLWRQEASQGKNKRSDRITRFA